MTHDIQVRICMAGQKEYAAAAKKWGEAFANAVVDRELQLFADSLDCFEEYAGYDFMQELIRKPE